MKNFIKTILVLLLVVTPITFVSAKKTTTTTTQAPKEGPGEVTVYVFYGDGCPHCKELEEFIVNTLKKEESIQGKFKVVYYETWNQTPEGKPGDHPQNITLLQEVGKAVMGSSPSGVPFYVIGEQYFSGYSKSFDEGIIKAILDESANPDYKDVVAPIVETMEVKPVASDPETSVEAEEDEKTNNTDVVGIIILGVTVVVVLAIIFTRHTEDDEDEDEEEVAVDKTVVRIKETKPTSTKTTTKKTSTSSKKGSTTKKTATKKNSKK